MSKYYDYYYEKKYDKYYSDKSEKYYSEKNDKYSKQKKSYKSKEQLEKDPTLIDTLIACKGKTLGCWCKPEKCHGDVLVELIEQYSTN